MEQSRKFGVSRQTVGKAMKELTRDGFIIGKPGIGSFTNPKRIETSQTPCGMKVPTIGIILSDGMLLHLDEYHAKNLSAALKILPEMPAFIRLLNLSSSDPEIILKDLENEQMDALLWIAPRQFHEPVIRELLTYEEVEWLDRFHETVCQDLKDYLEPEEQAWLREKTRPLA